MSASSDAAPMYQLRPAEESDQVFMRFLYGSTREHELEVTAWDRASKEAFITHQFAAQTTHYRKHMPEAEWRIVEVAGEPAGRLVLDRREGDIRIVDITLAPAFRGRGIGTFLLRDLQAAAAQGGRALSIHVEVNNPARNLYERLGFRAVGEGGPVYQLMEWKAGSCQEKTASREDPSEPPPV